MAYAKKASTKTLKIKTFGEFVEFLCCSFDKISSRSGPISIKSPERGRRRKGDPIEITISNPPGPIPFFFLMDFLF